jgi:hypothetical protein
MQDHKMSLRIGDVSGVWSGCECGYIVRLRAGATAHDAANAERQHHALVRQIVEVDNSRDSLAVALKAVDRFNEAIQKHLSYLDTQSEACTKASKQFEATSNPNAGNLITAASVYAEVAAELRNTLQGNPE